MTDRRQLTLRQLREALSALDGASDNLPVAVRVETDDGFHVVGGLYDLDIEADHSGDDNPMLMLDGASDVEPSRAQPFRAGDAVNVLFDPFKGQVWVVAVYDAVRDEAYIAGWPCTIVTDASARLSLKRAATDAQHSEMCESVARMRGDHGEGDPRRDALDRVRAAGGTP